MHEDRKKEVEEQEERIQGWMKKIKHKLVILSGKGGVGKSTISVNLAVALAHEGHNDRVGILDADITGPSIPKMIGTKGRQPNIGPPGVFPIEGPLGIKVISMDFFLPDDETPVIWRGPLRSSAIRQFLADVVWGGLDYLIVDLPPGTGDEALSIMQLVRDINGAIIVTIPSEVSQLVVKKAVTFTHRLNVPVIGIVENMSGFVCPKCGTLTKIFVGDGGEKISRDLGVPFLGRIPLDPRICLNCDQGKPFILEDPVSPSSKAFMELAKKVKEFLK